MSGTSPFFECHGLAVFGVNNNVHFRYVRVPVWGGNGTPVEVKRMLSPESPPVFWHVIVTDPSRIQNLELSAFVENVHDAAAVRTVFMDEWSQSTGWFQMAGESPQDGHLLYWDDTDFWMLEDLPSGLIKDSAASVHLCPEGFDDLQLQRFRPDGLPYAPAAHSIVQGQRFSARALGSVLVDALTLYRVFVAGLVFLIVCALVLTGAFEYMVPPATANRTSLERTLTSKETQYSASLQALRNELSAARSKIWISPFLSLATRIEPTGITWQNVHVNVIARTATIKGYASEPEHIAAYSQQFRSRLSGIQIKGLQVSHTQRPQYPLMFTLEFSL
jgi:hypothetical protein